MLNNLTSEIERVKSKPTVDKYRQQLEALLHQIQEELNDLHGDFVTQNLTTDSALVNGQVTAHSAEIDQALIDLIQTRHAILEYLESDNAELTDAIITRLNASNITSESIVTNDLDVRGNLQLNTISSTTSNTTTANAVTVNATDVNTDNVTGKNVDVENVNASVKIETPIVDTETVNTETVNSSTVNTDNLNVQQVLNAEDIFANDARINNIDNTNLTSHFIRNSYNRSIGTITCDPSRQTVYDWYAFTIPERVHNYTLYLHSKFTNQDQNEYEWSTTIVGNDTCAIITYTEDSQSCIKDFSFDRDTGRFRIRFFADETVDFKFDYLADEPLELDVEYNQDALLTIHEPIKNKGYIFQSYNDDTVEFYFGGAVFVHSLGAEFQEFEKQETKQLYVERNVFLPDIVNDDRSVATWDAGREGSYITNRDDGYGNLITKWEDPVDEIKHVDKLVTSDTIANYDGTVDVTVDPSDPQYEYPITNLGDDTEVHGDIKVDGNTTLNEHLFIGTTADYANATLANDAIVILTDEVDGCKVYRRRVDAELAVHLDPIAVMKSGETFDANGILVYDATDDTIKTSPDITVDSETINGNLHVKGDAYVDGTLHTVDEETITSIGDNIVLRANNPSSLGADYSGLIINNYNGLGSSLQLATDSDGTLKLGTGSVTVTTYNDIYYDPTTDKWYSDAELTTEVTPEGWLQSWSDMETLEGGVVHYEGANFAVLHATLEPVMTRDEDINLSDQGLLLWDAEDTEAKTLPLPTNDEDFLTASYTDAVTVDHPIVTDGTNFYNVNDTFATTTTEPAGTAGTPVSLGQTTELNGNYYYKASNSNWYIVNGTTTVGGNVIYDMGAQVTDAETIDALDASTDFVTFYYVVYTETTEPGKWGYVWKQKATGVYTFATMEDYEQYELDHPGVIPVGSQVIIEASKNYIKSEDIE